MIKFSAWNIDAIGSPLGRQYDNLTRSLDIVGNIPDGWTWDVLLQIGDNLNIISLSPSEEGLHATLTADMLAIKGKYRLQLRASQADKIRHTNIITVDVLESLSGDAQWPEVPSEFSQLEQRVRELSEEAGAAAEQAENAAEGVANNAKAAQEAAGQAQTAQDAAQGSAKQAGAAAAASAELAKTAADSAAAATQAAQSASDAVSSAQTSVQTATAQAQAAADAAQQARQAQQAAETAAGNAEQSANAAAQSAQEAEAAAENAKTIIDDTTAQLGKTWSSKNIVEKLAPAFEASGPVVTCSPVEGYPLHVVSQIVPLQEGSGDPSPENVRPISGWTEATLTHNDTPITLPFGQTVYGGTLDWTTGVLTVGSIFLKLNTTYHIGLYQFQDKNGVFFSSPLLYGPGRIEGVCSHGICTTSVSIPNESFIWLGVNNPFVYWVGVLDALGLSTVDEFKTWLNTQNVQIVYPMEEPVTIQLTPQEILALSGTNTIYTDTGDTTVSGRADPNTIIQQLATRIAALEGAATNL